MKIKIIILANLMVHHSKKGIDTVQMVELVNHPAHCLNEKRPCAKSN